ncbi:hypothetical protein M378DRAFT_168830 [Amanita muscaria Koide BX008]|uniref:Uncharacterized protein n=1 Tax=Amanita muscaria (strain Koide BX008) TaxID=946122 RepID=A0A0C2T078_AMAMK|nr:hypothetical protein M378DRAFT_168830 [Amanita muscaria Koide BX008]
MVILRDPSWVASHTSGNGVERTFIKEDESVAIGETHFELAGWVNLLKYVPFSFSLFKVPLFGFLADGMFRSLETRMEQRTLYLFVLTTTASTSALPCCGFTVYPTYPSWALPHPSLIPLSRSHFATPLRPLLALTQIFHPYRCGFGPVTRHAEK